MAFKDVIIYHGEKIKRFIDACFFLSDFDVSWAHFNAPHAEHWIAYCDQLNQ